MKEYPNVLKNTDLSRALEKNGYVVVPFLNPEELEGVLSLFEDLGELPGRFYSSTHVPEKTFQLNLKSKIDPIVHRAIGAALNESTQALGAALLNKPVGSTGVLPLHQDWNIVDEHVTRSFNIWIPLTNVTEENGAVRVLEGSHQVKHTYRGPNLGLELQEVSKDVLPFLKTIEMKAGEALIHDHALWHASGPNNSDQARHAMVMGCIEKGAEMKYYYQQPEGVVEYEADLNFYLFGNAPAGPGDLKKSKTLDHKVVQMGIDEFNLKFRGIEPKPKGWFSKVKEIFAS